MEEWVGCFQGTVGAWLPHQFSSFLFMIKHYLKGRCWDVNLISLLALGCGGWGTVGPDSHSKSPKLVTGLAPSQGPSKGTRAPEFLSSVLSTELQGLLPDKDPCGISQQWDCLRSKVTIYPGVSNTLKTYSSTVYDTVWIIAHFAFCRNPAKRRKLPSPFCKWGEMKPRSMPMSDPADIPHHEILGHKKIISFKHYDKQATTAFHFL